MVDGFHFQSKSRIKSEPVLRNQEVKLGSTANGNDTVSRAGNRPLTFNSQEKSELQNVCAMSSRNYL